jgi:transcriptional regulator with XRE-family HTH domain
VTRSRPNPGDTFRLALLALLGTTRWTQRELAARLGVSSKTIGRYVGGQALPPVPRRHHIVAALRDVDPAMLQRIAASLGLSKDVLPPRPPADTVASQRILDAATQEVAEKLDAGPVRVRAALARFVGHLAEASIEPRLAYALLTRR